VTLTTVIVVAAVAAVTFVLSYSGVHAVALQSGISASLARYYPGVFDAVLVIACAAAPLRDARLWTRLYTWLVIFIVIGLLAAMDAVHAMGVGLPHRQTAGTVAVLPWVLLLLAFTLWLVVLRHFRVQQSRQFTQVPSSAPESLTASETASTLGLPAADRQARHALPAGPCGPPSPGEPPAPGDVQGDVQGRDSQTMSGRVPTDGDSRESSDEAGAANPAPDAARHDAPSADSGEKPVPGGPDRAGETDGTPEVGGVPYATGPRLRRVRSLPVPPAEDEQQDEQQDEHEEQPEHEEQGQQEEQENGQEEE
jgi:hypothetical protein